MPAFWLGQIYLAKQQNGLEEVGYYFAVLNIQAIGLFLPRLLNSVSLPFCCELVGKKDSVRYEQLIWKSLLVNTGIALLFAFPMVVFPKGVLLLFGSDFQQGWKVLMVGGLGVLMYIISDIANQILISQSKNWKRLCIAVARIVIFAAFAYYLLTNGMGALGLHLSVVLSLIPYFSVFWFDRIRSFNS
jgi:O-antigen/teichoic acid export membrane protein